MSAIGETIGLLFDDQEPALARAISDAFELDLTRAWVDKPRRVETPRRSVPDVTVPTERS